MADIYVKRTFYHRFTFYRGTMIINLSQDTIKSSMANIEGEKAH